MTTGVGSGPRTPGPQTRLFEPDREPVYLSSWGKKEQIPGNHGCQDPRGRAALSLQPWGMILRGSRWLLAL